MTLAACIWYESSTKSGNKNKIGPSHKIAHHPLLSVNSGLRFSSTAQGVT